MEVEETGVVEVGGYSKFSAKAEVLNSSNSRTSEGTGDTDEREAEAGTFSGLSEGAAAASSGAENSSISDPLSAASSVNLEGQVRAL